MVKDRNQKEYNTYSQIHRSLHSVEEGWELPSPHFPDALAAAGTHQACVLLGRRANMQSHK